MNIAFAGFRHGHIMGLYQKVKEEGLLFGCFEENGEEREKVSEQFGIDFNFSTYEEILNSDEVDAVAIGDYYQKRGKMIIEALKHNKHVICDKPMCTSLEELDEIERLAKEKNLQVACMLDLRFRPQVHKAKELVEAGKIGDIKIISVTGQHPLNYGVRPSWYFEEGKHGGTINDIAIHGIDAIRFIAGKNLTNVEFKKEWNAYADKEPHFLDSAQFVADMDGVSVMGDVSYASPICDTMLPTYWQFRIWGTKGMLSFNRKEDNVYVYTKTEEVMEGKNVDSDFLSAFLDSVNGKNSLLATDEVIESQRQVLKIQKSF